MQRDRYSRYRGRDAVDTESETDTVDTESETDTVDKEREMQRYREREIQQSGNKQNKRDAVDKETEAYGISTTFSVE